MADLFLLLSSILSFNMIWILFIYTIIHYIAYTIPLVHPIRTFVMDIMIFVC